MKIHALLIGINNYNKISKLQGCVNDIKKIENYLTRNIASCEIIRLFDDQATKSSAINAFEQIKKKATESDTFLFYFAGHGTREHADPVWRETNHKLECIVCYDKNPDMPSDFLLADKELRYLIWQLSKTGCHIVTIFDCCHSGGNTRNFKPISEAFDNDDILARRYVHVYPQRRWSEFVFGSYINQADVTGKQVNDFLPQGAHVQIAACESDEVAFETKGEGVFTKMLLKVLEDTTGKISYYKLNGRIRQYIKFVYEQTPRIYSIGSSDEETQRLLFTPFLNKSQIGEQHFITEAVHNRNKGWLLNLGAIHGINDNSVIHLIDPSSPEKLYNTRVKEVFVDYTLLELKENINTLYEKRTLNASIQSFQLNEVNLEIIKREGSPEQLKKVADVLINGDIKNFKLAEDKALANYSLHITAELVYLTLPQDPYRPIVKPIEIEKGILNAASRSRLTEYLRHIGRWSFLQQLHNKTVNNLPKDPLKIDIMQILEDGSKRRIHVINLEHNTAHADLYPFVKSHLNICLTNQTNQRFYIAVAYLSHDFKAYINLLEDKIELLNPASGVSLGVRSKSLDGKTDLIPLKLPDVIQEYNWHHYTETIKIIISHEAFDMEALRLEALPSPYVLKDRTKNRETHRSFDFDDDEEKEDDAIGFRNWLTQTIHLEYPNIFYNKVTQDKVDQMLAWNKMNFFSKGLYGEET